MHNRLDCFLHVFSCERSTSPLALPTVCVSDLALTMCTVREKRETLHLFQPPRAEMNVIVEFITQRTSIIHLLPATFTNSIRQIRNPTPR